MNSQTRHVIDSMPDAMLLFDEETKDISIMNFEFKKLLMQENRWSEIDECKSEILNKPLLKIFKE